MDHPWADQKFSKPKNSLQKDEQGVVEACVSCHKGYHLFSGSFTFEIYPDSKANRCYSNECTCPWWKPGEVTKSGTCPRFGGVYCTKVHCRQAKLKFVELGVDDNTGEQYGYCK